MTLTLATRQIRLNEWAGIIKECRSSGLKIDDYCKQHNISRNRYFYWLRRVKEAALSQAGFVEMPSLNTVPEASSFNTQMIIKTEGAELCINNDTSSELLSRVLGVLGHA